MRSANLSVAYGGLRALTDVTLSVAEGQFVTVVGPNGAGKSTLFKTICGIVPPVAGTITFLGRGSVAPFQPRDRAHLGIAHVPEGRQVFKTLTVRENLEMGAYPKAGRAQLDADAGPHPHAVPDPGRTRRPAGRHAVGRRAADGGDRPRPGLCAPAADAGRAVDGPGPQPSPTRSSSESRRSTARTA